jgi:DNA-directed RNA polymerase subunit F
MLLQMHNIQPSVYNRILNIKRNTARAHLRSIFSKTGVRRQTELVRIFLNSVAWLSAAD